MSNLSQTQTTETEKKDQRFKDFHTDAAVWGLEFSFRLGDPLLPGEKIPFFQEEALKGGQKYLNQKIEVSPMSYVGKPLLIFFHPGDFKSEFNTLNLISSMLVNNMLVNMLVVSTDSLSVHEAWGRLSDLGMPEVALVSDKKGNISKAFGVLDVETHKSFSAMFLVDQNGIAQYTTISAMDITGDVVGKLKAAMN